MSGPLDKIVDGRAVLQNEGAAEIGVTTANGMVVVAFAEPLDWIGMDPKRAFTIAMLIVKNAIELDPSLAEGFDFEADVDFVPKGGDGSVG